MEQKEKEEEGEEGEEEEKRKKEGEGGRGRRRRKGKKEEEEGKRRRKGKKEREGRERGRRAGDNGRRTGVEGIGKRKRRRLAQRVQPTRAATEILALQEGINSSEHHPLLLPRLLVEI